MKPVEFQMFDSPEDVLRYARCVKCGERINHWGHAVKLDKPEVFGSATQDPKTFTHSNIVECKNKCTAIRVLGCMRNAARVGCVMSWIGPEPWLKPKENRP